MSLTEVENLIKEVRSSVHDLALKGAKTSTNQALVAVRIAGIAARQGNGESVEKMGNVAQGSMELALVFEDLAKKTSQE